jgi:uncharacterized membrane protein
VSATSATTEPTSSATRSRTRPSGLTIGIIVFCLLGVVDAGYLVYVHYAKLTILCVGGHHGQSSCATVQSSPYAQLDGVPVALLGLIGYVVILLSLALRGELGRAIGFGVALIGFGFSMYLTYRELFTIHAICEWCVGSATIMTVLVVLTGIRFLRAAQ